MVTRVATLGIMACNTAVRAGITVGNLRVLLLNVLHIKFSQGWQHQVLESFLARLRNVMTPHHEYLCALCITQRWAGLWM
jgi:hypothetical protein